MDAWASLAAFILGLVEGMTEFVPVSSTGHMIIADDFWFRTKERFTPEVSVTFKIVIQLGSILAVVILMRDRFKSLLDVRRGGTAVLFGNGASLSLMKVLVGLLPAGILYLLLDDYIDRYLFSTRTVVIGLAAGAVLMLAAERFKPLRAKTQTVDQVTYGQALAIGLFQCLSMWPGFSRSGSTISGGVLLGMNHRAAADFTFIMAVPIMTGVSLLSLLKYRGFITAEVMPFLLVGFVSAFLFALISIRFFLKLINRIRLVPFAIYRLVLAGVISIFFL